MTLSLMVALATAVAAQSANPAQDAAAPPQPAPAASAPAAPAASPGPAPVTGALAAKPFPTKKVLLAALAGATAGAVLSRNQIDFSQLPASEQGAHEVRAELVYSAIGGALSAALMTKLTAGPATGPSFWKDPWSLPTVAGVITVHALDFASTRYFRDRGKDEWLLTNGVVDNRTAFITTEVAAAAAGLGLLWVLHRTGHTKIEHWVALGYIGLGTASAIANFRYPSTGHGLFGQ